MQLIEESLKKEETEGGPGWYAIYTRHQHEKVIARLLSEKGIEVFLPVQTVVRRWKDRTKQLSLPIFPCYVFIWGSLQRRFDIVTTPGFQSFVSFGDQPVTIPREEIEAIRQAFTSGSRIEPYPFLRFGDKVRIRSGPLEGVEGILVRKKNSFRLVLSVNLLEKSVAVEIDAGLVERVVVHRGEVRPYRMGASAAVPA